MHGILYVGNRWWRQTRFIHVVWEEREDAEFATYVGNQNRCMYLTIVHMWDKQHGFPLVVTKEEIPTDIAIDDSVQVDARPKGLKNAIKIKKCQKFYFSLVLLTYVDEKMKNVVQNHTFFVILTTNPFCCVITSSL